MQTTELRTFNNDWYKTGAGKSKMFFWYLCNSLLLKKSWPGSKWRASLLRSFGAKVGDRVVIKPCVNIKYPWKLSIESDVWIGENVWIDNLSCVSIGSNSCISQGALLLCGNHNYKKKSFDLISEPIILEQGVWIGAKAIVCGGVTCNSHSILSVGSVANKDLEAYSVYQGIPAVKVRDRVFD